MPRSLAILFAWISAFLVQAAFDIGFGDDADLTNFVTRPDIKAPLFDLKTYDSQSIEPGFWFVDPYVSIQQEQHPRNYYQACQTGPHIYDSSGELVWSGACLVKNQNTCDFRPFRLNGTYFLSAIIYGYGGLDAGRGIILDSSYNIIQSINASAGLRFNMHELNVLEDSYTALYLQSKPQYVEIDYLGDDYEGGWVTNPGFVEVDLNTGARLFNWWVDDKIHTSESTVKAEHLNGPPPEHWGWFHPNSVDKNKAGDYLISARFTDAIYKISRENGSILWRLGGTRSSFVLDGFNFSRQHDARWLECNDDNEVISFLDNASDGYNRTSTVSSALIVRLDKRSDPMTAHVVKRWTRPDGRLSPARGNIQTLPGGNVFIGWSGNSYITEHSSDGHVLMEASFRSARFVTYRAYKANFIGAPSEPPVLKAFVYGTTVESSTTVFYVSWNGATEVAAWRFYGDDDDGTTVESVLIGTSARTGFETVFQSTGRQNVVYAEAVGKNGSVLGRSLPWTIVALHVTSKELEGGASHDDARGYDVEISSHSDEL